MVHEIIDNNGVIHSGTESEMLEAFAAMSGDREFFDTKKAFKQAVAKWESGWDGDLKLVNVINVHR